MKGQKRETKILNKRDGMEKALETNNLIMQNWEI